MWKSSSKDLSHSAVHPIEAKTVKSLTCKRWSFRRDAMLLETLPKLECEGKKYSEFSLTLPLLSLYIVCHWPKPAWSQKTQEEKKQPVQVLPLQCRAYKENLRDGSEHWPAWIPCWHFLYPVLSLLALISLANKTSECSYFLVNSYQKELNISYSIPLW